MLPDDKAGYIARYCALGFSIIPLSGKRPIWENWTEQCTKDVARARQIWKQYPEANVGIVLGRPSGIFALDFDERSGGIETYDSLQSKYGYFKTLVAQTGGGGMHVCYRLPNFDVATRTRWMQGVELRGTGAQIVAAPSIHPETGAPYVWDTGDAEDGLDWDHIHEAPDWLLEKLQDAGTRRQVREGAQRPTEKISKGGRHMTMVSMAGILRHRIGATQEEIDGFLQAFNRLRNDPPYEPAHVAAISKSMVKYQPDAIPLVKACARLYSRAKEHEAREKAFLDRYKPITALDIMQGSYKPLPEVIEDMIYVGLTVLYGPPKIGKSFLSTQIALAVSHGAALFHSQRIIRPGKVAYISLEESASQTHSKLRKLQAEPHAAAANIQYYYELPKLMAGGLEVLKKIIEETAPTMMIIDSFRSISSGAKAGDVVEREYAHVASLSKLGKDNDTAIVLIHHGSKRNQGDSLMDGAAGTHGITAGADCVARLVAEGDNYLLNGTGREIGEFNFAMRRCIRDGLGWQMIDKGDGAKFSSARLDIFRLLKEDGAQKPEAIARKLGKNAGTTRSMLRYMIEAGQIFRQADGSYVALGDE